MTTKTVIINSPPGSGNTYLTYLLKKVIECDEVTVNHDLEILNSDLKQVALIRNPYESIASAASRHFFANEYPIPEEDKWNIEDTKIIQVSINDYMHRSRLFFESIQKKSDHIKLIAFDDFKNNELKYAEEIAKFYNFEFKDPDYDINEFIYKEATDFGVGSRLSNTKSKEREILDEMVRSYNKIEEVYETYLAIKDSIQSTRNML